uniref:BVpp12b protein n=1 Tax=Chelonus inanitus TaxID=49201 RepID=D7FB52_9HYME|nr:BVpp12b protein [Chelonus inanitus]
MKSYLARGIIMYTSNISKKEYALFIDIEVNKFVSYIEQDKVNQIKSYMIKTLLKRLAQNMRALSTNSITPLPLMSLDELPIPREQSTNTGALY